MAETAIVRAVLTRFGAQNSNGTADVNTLAWITTRAGLDRTSVFNSMQKPDMDHVFKRLAKEADDPGTDNGGRVPAGQIPNYNLTQTNHRQRLT